MDRGHPAKTTGANGKGSNPGAVGRWKHLHTEPSSAAKAILGGRGKGDTGSASSNNTSKVANPVGQTMGSDYTAGNINTRG